MPKKRMILEEVEEKTLLVPGTPENPIKLREKAKDILLKLHLAEKEGRNPYDGRYYEDAGKYGAAFDQLHFLGLVQEAYQFSGEQREAMLAEAKAARATYASEIIAGKDPARYGFLELESKAAKQAWRLTDAGRALLIAGTVTVSL